MANLYTPQISVENSKAVQEAKAAYNKAYAAGDKAGMQAAHAAAESARNQAGYSSDASGLNYKALNNTSSSSSNNSSTGLVKSIASGSGTTTTKQKGNASTPSPSTKTTNENTKTPTQYSSNGATGNTTAAASNKGFSTKVERGGNLYDATIVNGKTYLSDGTSLKDGDKVTDASGNTWYYDASQGKGVTYKQYETTHPEVASYTSPLYGDGYYNDIISQLDKRYAGLANDLSNFIDSLTKAQANELEDSRAAQEAYTNQLIAQNAYNQLTESDNLALRNAAAGDTGGIGSKLYSDQQASYDSNLLKINLEQAQFEREIDTQIAQANANGEYQKANLLNEIKQQQISNYRDLMLQARSEQVGVAEYLDNYRFTTKETEVNTALQRLNLGLFNEDDAIALGATPEEAEYLSNYFNVLRQTNLSEAQAALQSYANGGLTRTYYSPNTNKPDTTNEPDAGYTPSLTVDGYNDVRAAIQSALNEAGAPLNVMTQSEFEGRKSSAQNSGQDYTAYADNKGNAVNISSYKTYEDYLNALYTLARSYFV